MSLTDKQKANLKDLVKKWRSEIGDTGPQHSLWDCVFDAEALLFDT